MACFPRGTSICLSGCVQTLNEHPTSICTRHNDLSVDTTAEDPGHSCCGHEHDSCSHGTIITSASCLLSHGVDIIWLSTSDLASRHWNLTQSLDKPVLFLMARFSLPNSSVVIRNSIFQGDGTLDLFCRTSTCSRQDNEDLYYGSIVSKQAKALCCHLPEGEILGRIVLARHDQPACLSSDWPAKTLGCAQFSMGDICCIADDIPLAHEYGTPQSLFCNKIEQELQIRSFSSLKLQVRDVSAISLDFPEDYMVRLPPRLIWTAMILLA